MKQIKTVLVAVIFSLCFIPCFADNAVTGSGTECVYGTLNTYTGPSTIKANWDPNTINLYWYNDDQKLTVQTAANTCNYDSGIALPSTNPTKTGYTFSGWEVGGGAPTGYTLLEYIQSSGTQYIDTGYNFTSGNKLQLKVNPNNTSGWFFGANSGGTEVLLGNTIYFSSKYKPATGSPSNYFSVAKVYDIIMNVNTSDAFLIVDNQLLFQGTNASFNGKRIYLFALEGTSSDTTATRFVNIKVYDFKVWQNDNLVQHLVPVKRNSDNVVGMYDMISGTLFTNAGSGTFTAGPVVQ